MDSRASFSERERFLNHRHGRWLALAVGGAALAWWPFDRIVFAGRPETIAAFDRWRLGVVGVCLAAFAVLRFVRPRDALAVVVAGALACAAIVGHSFARIGGLDTAWFHTSYFAALYSFPLAVSLPRRAVLTGLAPVAFGVAFFATRPTALSDADFAMTIGFHVFAVSLSVLFGHSQYLLVRENFLQSRSLEEANGVLEARVSARTAELRGLARHIDRDRESERRRLAREIHDETGQLLTALRMELAMARAGAGRPDETATAFDRMDKVLDQALDATRDLVSELRPRVLDDLGLAAAVEWLVGRFASRSDLACTWRIEPPDLDVDAERATAAFRILQESLTNVARHASARSVEVDLLRDDARTLRLEVADDGRGFAAPARGGFGLLGMRERAHGLGGTLDVESIPGAGTKVRLVLPAPPEVAS